MVLPLDMSNQNETNFCTVSGPGGGGSELYIMVCKAAIVTYIWSFSENLQNYKKLILLRKDCSLMVDMSNNTECF